MRNVKIRVRGVFGKPSETTATVTIERGTGLISVRPLRRRRVYTLPLADVARWIQLHVIRAEAKARPKKARRKP